MFGIFGASCTTPPPASPDEGRVISAQRGLQAFKHHGNVLAAADDMVTSA